MLKQNPQIIRNIAFCNRVADWTGDEIGHDTVGWKRHNGINQQFAFEHRHGKEYRISTTNGSGKAIYISSDRPSEDRSIVSRSFSQVLSQCFTMQGDTLVGGREHSVYTVQEFIGYYHISIDDDEGEPLFWTLTSGAVGTEITLLYANNSLNQLWALIDPGAD